MQLISPTDEAALKLKAEVMEKLKILVDDLFETGNGEIVAKMQDHKIVFGKAIKERKFT